MAVLIVGRWTASTCGARGAPLLPLGCATRAFSEAVCAQLPEGRPCRAVQLPPNFAEAQAFWVGHAPHAADGAALDRQCALAAPTVFKTARQHGQAVGRRLRGG
eukprot:CAMPEP_0204561948 /NCGR_PEP_ID=MMETSP0661-20131031/33479_1 /ASSEMBLY_ACC=CAM_ASM_000606 /TAXON_ID=109239 /ORGANISM="Alexandrium margalefi, Strain AMGDE01CS-322" /LENGTH=103 /DNA_ID=CAMNT_0051569407 /DNA_START=50 /DNA_END=359 /DNA_ORIENTATION=+